MIFVAEWEKRERERAGESGRERERAGESGREWERDGNGRNQEFAVLSVLAMTYTVMGHTGVSFLTLDWLFPYDSFHMPLFVFISGYFFRTSTICLANTKKFLYRQCKRLLLPFFTWNLIYGLFAQIASSHWGILWCHADEFWYQFIVRPFTYGNGFFEFNAPSWFILMLFEVKCFSWILHLVFKRTHYCEYIIGLLTLVLAATAVLCAKNLERTPLLITVTRMLYMTFWLQIGIVYKATLEKYESKISNLVYFGIILAIQTGIWIGCREQGIIAGIWNSEFTNGPFLTILAAFTGIAFSLRVAKILTKSIGDSSIVRYISMHTFSIMMHQFLGFACLNLVAWYISSTLNLQVFDVYAFQTDMWYRCLPGGLSQLRVLYAIAGFAGPLCGCLLWEKLRLKIRTDP